MDPIQELVDLGMDENDVEDIASQIADDVLTEQGSQNLSLRWSIESAVKEAFGVEDDE